jgi:hypothetical protein
MNPLIQVLLEDNVRKVMRDGPRCRSDYHTPILARDRVKRRVLISGIGCMGVGQVWQDEQPYHADYHGYDDAPEQIAPPAGQPF